MCLVESNQVSQRPHVRMCKRGEVVCDLRPEFEQQGSELVGGVYSVGVYVACICVHNGGAKAFHYAQRVLRKRDRQLVAWNAASVIAVNEVTHVAADSLALQRAPLKARRVIGLSSLYDTEKGGVSGRGTGHWHC